MTLFSSANVRTFRSGWAGRAGEHGMHCLRSGAQGSWRHLARSAAPAGSESLHSPGVQEEADEDAPPGPSQFVPLAGRFSYAQLKNLPEEQLRFELRLRGLSTAGRRLQLASRVLTALAEENMVWSQGEGGSDGEEGRLWSSSGSSSSSAASQEEEACPLRALQSSPSGLFMRSSEEAVMSNPTGAQVMFLWGHTAPNGLRVVTSAALRTKRMAWLFDCGEDTQRHLLKNPAISWVRIDRIFISSLSVEALLGLPGMLCTLSAARAKGHENADMPIHVYGPQGLVDFINNMLSVSRTYLEMPVVIHEFSTRPVADIGAGPQPVNKRARLYAQQLPPDQLNPQGYYDGEIRTMLARHRRKRSGGGIDERAASLPLQLPEPGDPTRTDLKLADMVWTIRADEQYLIRAAPLKHRQPCFGYFIQEADKSGRLDPEAAIALGVAPGAAFTQLKEGKAVVGRDGSLVLPEQVVGPPKRGRRWAFVGPCLDSSLLAHAAGGEGCDLLVHSIEPPLNPSAYPSAAAAGQRSAAAMAGACAARMGTRELILWQPSATFLQTPAAQDPDHPEQILRAAEGMYGGSHVSFAGTFTAHQIEHGRG